MSAFNEASLLDLINNLQSNKIKERNEALTKLEQFTSQSNVSLNKLNSALLVSIIDATFQNIAIEKASYVRSKLQLNHTIEERLTRASSLLRIMISKIKDNKFKTKFKSKNYLSILTNIEQSSIVRTTGGQDELLEPVALNLLKVFNILLALTEFRVHLLVSENQNFLGFCLKGLNLLIFNRSQEGNRNINEKLTIEFLQALITLCFNKDSTSPNFLRSGRSDYHLKIIDFINCYYQNVFSSNKKESWTLILLFRIINQLLITLSVNNIKYCHRLFRIGVRFFNGLKFITFENLKEQIVIFINLVSPFVDLSKVPKQIGDNWNLNSQLQMIEASNKENNSIVIDHDDEVITSSAEINVGGPQHKDLPSEEAMYINELNTFVNQLFDLLLSSNNDYQLSSEDVHLKIILEVNPKQMNWFNFESIALKRGSQSEKAWLLRSGICGILERYFQSKEKLSVQYGEISNSSTFRFLDSNHLRPNKIRKVNASEFETASDYLSISTNLVEFLFSLATFMSNEKLTISSFQLLAFFLSSPSSTTKFEKEMIQTIVSNILKTFELQNVHLNYWSLLCLKLAIQKAHSLSKESLVNDALNSFHINQVLRYSLDMIKAPSLVDISCSLTSFILELNLKEEVKWTIEGLVIKQFESMIQLCEINGPVALSRHSLYFWFRVYDFCKTLKLAKTDYSGLSKGAMNDKIQDWIISKWDHLSSLSNVRDLEIFAIFVPWLCGSQNLVISSESVAENTYVYKGELMDYCIQWNDHKKLRSFISLNGDTELTLQETMNYVLESLPTTPRNIEVLLTRVCKFGDNLQMFHNNDQYHKRFLYQWIFTILDISNYIHSQLDLESYFRALSYQITRMVEDEFENDSSPHNNTELAAFLELVCEMNDLHSPVMKNFVSNLQADRILDIAITQLNGSVSISSIGSSVDTFKGLGYVKRADSPGLSSGGQDMNYYKLQYLASYEQILIGFIIQSGKAKELSPVDILQGCCKTIERILSNHKLLHSFHFLLNDLSARELFLKKNTIEAIERLVTVYAERLLGNFEFERNELTIIIGCQMLSCFSVYWCTPVDTVIKQDCTDVANYMFRLVESHLVDTEKATSYYIRLMLVLLSHETSGIDMSTSMAKIVQNALYTKDNGVLLSFTKELVTFLHSQRKTKQAIIYNSLQELFPSPQESVESAATYCYFIGSLSQSSYFVLTSGVFNLIELANFKHVRPYIQYAFSEFCFLYAVKDIKLLFRAFRLDLFKYWSDYGMKLRNFPFDLFNYHMLEDFVQDNYKELVALKFSKVDNTDEDVVALALEVLGSEKVDIIVDSFSLIIAVGYTEKSMRSNIIKRMRQILSSEAAFIEQLRSQSSLIVFELLRFCDVSTESHIIRTLKMVTDSKFYSNLFHDDSQTLQDKLHVSIPPAITYEAIEEILVRLFGKSQSFWNLPSVYFLTTRILVLIDEAISTPDKLANLRRIKFLMSLPGVDFFHESILKKLVVELSKQMKDAEIANEICNFFLVYWSSYPDMKNQEVYTPSFITIISKVFDSRGSGIKNLSTWIKEFLENNSSSHPCLSLLKASLEVNLDESPSFGIEIIEEILEDESFQYDFDEGMSLYSLISYLFNSSASLDKHFHLSSPTSAIVARKLLGLKNLSSPSFMLWRARYLGKYYSQTGSSPSCIIRQDSLMEAFQNHFEENVTTMDNIFLEMLHYKTSDIQISSCIEYVLGVIIWRNYNKDEDKSVIQYNRNFLKYEQYILPMNFHTCILLVHDSENAKKILHVNSLHHTVNSLETLVTRNDPDIWMSILTLAIVNELAPVTALAPLISTFISKVPGFSKRIFSKLVMFYIYSSKNGGVQIHQLVSQFYGLERSNISNEIKKIFIELVLMLRIGAKDERKEFVTAYKNVDLQLVYHDAITVGMPKTALMIMENHFSDPSSLAKFRWQDERAFLTKVYESLEDSHDLIYGLPVEPTLEYGMNLLNRGTGNSWKQILFNSGLLDTSLATGGRFVNSSKIVDTTLNSGLHGISKVLADTWYSGKESNQQDEQSYEWSWKLNQWDIPVSKRNKSSKTENEILYKTFKLMNDYPQDSLQVCQESLCELISNKAKFLSFKDEKEQSVKLRSWMRTLATLTNMEEIIKCQSDNLKQLIEADLEESSWYKNSDFENFENILIGRKATYEFLGAAPLQFTNLRREEAWFSVLHETARYGDFARRNQESQKSINSAIYFNDLVKEKFSDSNNELKEFVSKCAKFQIASTFWDQGETDFPVSTLKDIVKRERVYQMTRTTGDGEDDILRLPYQSMQLTTPYISAMIVKWASESRQESSGSLMDNYMEIVATEPAEMKSQQAEIYHHFATFCDNYLRDQLLKEDLLKFSKLIMTKEKELLQLKQFREDRRNSKEDRDAAKQKYARIYRMRSQDKEEFNRLKSNRDRFVQNAVQFYLRCLAVSDEFDETDVDKFCGLWLEYSNSDEVNNIVKELIESISNHKFIAWISQLMSRLVDELNNFQYVLTMLLEAMSYEHPYHSAYLIKSLRLHLDILNNDPMVESRSLAADKLWRKLSSKSRDFVDKILNPVDQLCEASSSLANERFEKASKVKLSGLKTGKFWIQQLPFFALPPPTIEIPVDKRGKYDNVPNIIATESNLSVATSGISLPKIITFKLSNGGYHKMLLKGGSDDLRQDAIMEQVFEKVNKIFQNYRETRIRNLRIRTYKVVPLGPQAGVIEFVRNSVSLNDVLKPLHDKQDKLKLDGARSLMKKVQKSTIEDRIKAYYSIMERVKPVMRLFFYNNFLNSQEWFESKMTYTHGISTTSFVGHVLGLGDRHSNNILLDNLTGEPIHIDLGVAFDQGRRLPIPETVPFRLTRDIVDGFGITGVEGCFIKSSEHVLKVLRFEKERIMNILNILKYDPLYSWTLSPIRKQKLQEQGDMFITEDIEATDAIEGVRKKLNSSDLSVEAMVRELTQEATDPDRLALIYMGWSPFY